MHGQLASSYSFKLCLSCRAAKLMRLHTQQQIEVFGFGFIVGLLIVRFGRGDSWVGASWQHPCCNEAASECAKPSGVVVCHSFRARKKAVAETNAGAAHFMLGAGQRQRLATHKKAKKHTTRTKALSSLDIGSWPCFRGRPPGAYRATSHGGCCLL